MTPALSSFRGCAGALASRSFAARSSFSGSSNHVRGNQPAETSLASRTLPPDGGLSVARIRSVAWSHKWLILAGILAVGIGLWQGTLYFLGPAVAVDRATRTNLVETVVATGSVQTPYRVIIGSQITGTVQFVQVDEGQRVTKGQVLVSIEDHELVADLAQAEGAVAQAEAHVRELADLTLPTARDSLKQAQATLLNAQQIFDRAAILVRQGDETRVVLDAAQKNLDVARNQVRSAELAVFTASSGGSDYVTAQTQLNQARANRDTAASRLGYATIAAPRAGVLITRNVENGTVVQPGNTLLVLAPDGETQLLVEIDERNLGKLALGQQAVASADAYSNQRFPATVVYINPGVDITKASVEVKLNVDNPPAYLVQDMTVSVDIEVAHSDNALVVPGRSVHDALSDAPWVMAIRKGRAVKQPVKIGVQGNTQTEILSGIAEGEVVLPATSDVAAGQRVRAISS
jgi:HlyD family secretion protein